ncbi:MAG: fumarate reductase subunit FrdD [Pseudomonadota bacterium]|nr:fumarate reductase subunit FrdD [Pseudomonadota bacterium]
MSTHHIDRTDRPPHPADAGAPAEPPWRRSIEPVFWALFGAGGTLAALFGPALALITLVLVPLGLLLAPETLSYARVLAFAQWWPGKLVLLATVSLFAFHSVHRIHHTLHDLGLPASERANWLWHGLAALLTLVCAALLWRL